MTTSEMHPAGGDGHRRIPSQRSVARIAGVALTVAIAGVVAIRSRTSVDPRRLWEEAQAALKSEDVATARSRLAALGRLRTPTDGDWTLRAQIEVADGRPDDALVALARVSDGGPLAAQALLMAGRIERQRNRMPPAEAYLRKALARDPRLVSAHKELIFILGMQLRRREVDAEFKALSRLTPLSHHELLTWGLTHFTVWVEESAEALEAFIRSDPSDRYSRLSLATVLMRFPAQHARAEEILENLPASDPAAAALQIELKLQQGRVDEARELLARASGRDPKLARIRGRIALMDHDHVAAIRHFREALTDEPYDRVSLTDLGQALRLSGDISAGETYLSRARRLDELHDLFNWVRQPDRENQPSDPTRFGRACEAAGLRDEARGWYLLAIGRDPLNAEAQRALQRLRATTPP